MLRLIAQLLLVIGGAIASWFVARDAPNFGVIQLLVALLFLVWIVVVVGFSPSVLRWFRNRYKR